MSAVDWCHPTLFQPRSSTITVKITLGGVVAALAGLLTAAATTGPTINININIILGVGTAVAERIRVGAQGVGVDGVTQTKISVDKPQPG
jgi:hypothetical protein